MSIFDNIAHAFEPVGHAVQNFNPQHAAQAIVQAIEQPVKSKIPGHMTVAEAEDILKIAEPSSIDIDVFASLAVALGVELQFLFDMGITINNPVEKIGALVDLVQHPPETVHQLCDKLWGIVPDDIRISETLQAVVGETVVLHWSGPDAMKRVTQYIGKKGWLEKRLRP